MAYDLLIRNGTVVDGTGAAARQADVAIANGRIAEIGRIRDGAAKVIDAESEVVSIHAPREGSDGRSRLD